MDLYPTDLADLLAKLKAKQLGRVA